MTLGLPIERSAVPTRAATRQTEQGKTHVAARAGADEEAPFPKLLSNLKKVEHEQGRKGSTRDQVTQTAPTGDSFGGQSAGQASAAAVPLSAADLLAALVAAGARPTQCAQAGKASEDALRLRGAADAVQPRLAAADGSADEVTGLGADTEAVQLPATKVIVLRQEMHLAPAASQSAANPAIERLAAALVPRRADGKADATQREPQSELSTAGASEFATGGDSLSPITGAANGSDRDRGLSSPERRFGGGAAAQARQESTVTAVPRHDVDVGIAELRKDLNQLPQSPAPALQIADRVAREVSAYVDTTRPPAPTEASAKLVSSGVVRVLHIELQPADLGTVMVRMSLKDDALHLQLDAGREQTARLLQKDRETLTSVLRAAGYHIDGVSVRVTDTDRASVPQPASQTIPDATQSQTGSFQPDRRPTGGEAHTGNQAGESRSIGNSHDDESGSVDRLGGDLYV